MHRVGWKIFAVKWMALFAIFSVMLLNACDNSTEADASEPKTSLQSSGSKAKSSSSKKAYPDTFKPNDKEYPYANIPRIVIYTKNQQKIEDRETEIPAKLQIWGKEEAESEIKSLTIRGRGNSSWTDMPKKSYKIEFEKKQSLLGMPKDKDWALIANYADKTLMRNYIAYRLSATLGAYYAPRSEFAELYLNGEYLGVYLITETVKIAENRINIPKNESSYIVEFDGKYRAGELVFFSDVLTANNKGKAFRVHDPKNATDEVLDSIQIHVQNFERYLKTINSDIDNNVDEWIDVEESIKHYWVQELTKNPDAEFCISVFFSWVRGETIKLGPVWDFDLAFGNHKNEKINNVENWYMRKYWYLFLFNDEMYKERSYEFWNLNHTLFIGVLDSIEVNGIKLNKAAKNNFKRWKILEKENQLLRKSYQSYENAVADLKVWVEQRIQWIENQFKK